MTTACAVDRPSPGGHCGSMRRAGSTWLRARNTCIRAVRARAGAAGSAAKHGRLSVAAPAPAQVLDGAEPWPWRRIAWLLAAIGSLGLGLVLAGSHALAPWGAPGLLLLWSMLVWRWPGAWLIGLPALLPLANLSPWTGALMFDESDLLVLGAAAGGYARLVIASAGARFAAPAPAFPRLARVAMAFLGLPKHADRPPTQESALAAALVGALVVGLLGSVQNAPRAMLLFWLLLWIFLLSGRNGGSVRTTRPEYPHASSPVAGKAVYIA